PPRKRPVLLAGIAVAALTIFVLLVALTPPRSPLPAGPRIKPGGPVVRDDAPAKSTAAAKSKDGPGITATRVISSEKDFADALAEDGSLRLVLDRDLHLTDSGLTYRGGGKRTLVVESKNPTEPVTIQAAYPAEIEGPVPFWAGLTVDGGSVL